VADERPNLRPVDFDPFAPVADREGRIPLTEAQREMWTAASMSDEANCSYNQCFALTLDGPLRVDSLRVALDQVVARHEALRTVVSGDGLEQRLNAPFSLDVPELDLSSAEPEARAQELERILKRECDTPFDLSAGPLIRALVVRESTSRHVLVLTVHHIVCDGWSSSVLFSDLGRLYAADCVGIPARLAPAVSFRRYVMDLADDEHIEAAANDEEYWAAQYPDGAPVLDLPLTRARPARKTYRSGRETLRIDAELYGAVRKAGAKAGATLFATLVAAFEALVHRLSGQDDFVIGIPLAAQLELENPALVAHCVNTVPLRSRIDPDLSFAEHARGVRDALSAAQLHGHVTFGTIVRRLRVPRDPGRTPLVSITFTTDRIGAPFDFGDVEVAAIATPKEYSNFEVALTAVDDGRGIILECDYNTDLFDASTIKRWLSHYETLLRGLVADPTTAVDALPLLGQDEIERMLDEAQPAAVAVEAAGCLHERFEQWARSGPDRIAVSCDGESLTFGQLDRRANELAVRLQGLGVGPDVVVGLRTDRSPALMVAMLGILKAGGAYLPLDPSFPRDRVEFMLADSEVTVVVTEPEFAGDFAGLDVTLMVVDDELGELDDAPASGATAETLAYLMYTSGSTGQPKGVPITHRNVLRLFESTEHVFDFGPDDVWTQFHSYAFDFSVLEIWGALLYGGRLVLVPFWVGRSPEAFHELVLAERVTVLGQTPSVLRQFIDADLAREKPTESALRYVLFGAESLDFTALGPWFDRYGDAQPQFWNLYGPTETTIFITYRRVTAADVDARLDSVIGVPVPDVRLLLLDRHGIPVPIGATGEIYAGGGGLSSGYRNRPELTTQRFVDDPYSRNGAKLYRTGDLARRRENGDLVYLGRIDDQVKIRGFRIELGEIEAALARHPSVTDAVVLAREDIPNDRRLVAYVTADDEPDTDDLKRHLRAILPDYMVPPHILALHRFPINSSGKIDRKALPVPDYSLRDATRPYLAPSTPTETAVARLWSSALGMPTISSDDNFFDLGGDSMKAAQIVAAMRSEFGDQVALRHLFERPTISGLAELVDVLAVSAVQGGHAGEGDRETIEL
jgi:amino acid adenylation domain-containing protein